MGCLSFPYTDQCEMGGEKPSGRPEEFQVRHGAIPNSGILHSHRRASRRFSVDDLRKNFKETGRGMSHAHVNSTILSIDVGRADQARTNGRYTLKWRRVVDRRDMKTR